MKNKIIYFTAIIGLTCLFSCEKDENKAVLSENPKGPSLLTAGFTSGQTYILLPNDAAQKLQFTYSPADYGFKAALNYSLVLQKQASTFNPSIVLATTTKDTLAITTDALNSTLLGLQADPTVPIPMQLQFAVRATGISNPDTLYTDVLSVTLTPYYVPITYPVIYVPGSYKDSQGNTWSPSTAPTIRSILSDNNYEGFVYMALPSGASSISFKFTEGPNWDNNWGSGPSGGTNDGTLQKNGGDITSATATGTYKLSANLNSKTYKAIPYNVGLIGDATPNGWNSPDSKMTYVKSSLAANKDYWTATFALVVGKIKFRLNDDWAWNLGGDINNLSQGGADIAITEAGNYTINLYIAGATNKCTIVKN